MFYLISEVINLDNTPTMPRTMKNLKKSIEKKSTSKILKDPKKAIHVVKHVIKEEKTEDLTVTEREWIVSFKQKYAKIFPKDAFFTTESAKELEGKLQDKILKAVKVVKTTEEMRIVEQEAVSSLEKAKEIIVNHWCDNIGDTFFSKGLTSMRECQQCGKPGKMWTKCCGLYIQ